MCLIFLVWTFLVGMSQISTKEVKIWEKNYWLKRSFCIPQKTQKYNITPNKAGIFEGSFLWGWEGSQFGGCSWEIFINMSGKLWLIILFKITKNRASPFLSLSLSLSLSHTQIAKLTPKAFVELMNVLCWIVA